MKFTMMLLLMSLIVSCHKQTVQVSNIPEKVNVLLLEKYVDYKLAIERESMFGQEFNMSPLTQKEFEEMIDNFLANERLTIKQKKWIVSMSTPGDLPDQGTGCYDANGNPCPCPSVNSTETSNISQSVSCSGSFQDYNTINMIVFTAQLNGSSSQIVSNAFAFGGVGATWAPVGTIMQTPYGDVISYKQYYTESYTLPSGLLYTQIYLLYGNIVGSNGTCTVYGMQVKTSKAIE